MKGDKMKNRSLGWNGVLLLVTLLLSMALVACGGNDEEVEPETLETAPEIFLLHEGERLSGQEVAACWPEQSGGTVDLNQDPVDICEDSVLPTFEDTQFTQIAPGQPLELELQEPLPDRVALVLANPNDMSAIDNYDENEVQQNTISWQPEVPAGEYVLAAMGFWENVGGATYYFPVSFQEGGE
jgi:hypothetical protein